MEGSVCFQLERRSFPSICSISGKQLPPSPRLKRPSMVLVVGGFPPLTGSPFLSIVLDGLQ